MKVIIKTTLEQKYSDNTEENVLKLSETLTGGSAEEFQTPTDFDPAVTLQNTFEVKEVEQLSFELDEDNTFDENIFDLLKTPKEKIAFIHMMCYSAGSEKIIPVRFELLVEAVSLGNMSSFYLNNIKDMPAGLAGMTIKDIVVATDTLANLIITVGSVYKS